MIEDSFSLARDWPGKSKPREHPAIWHMLDVAACAERLIEGHRAFSRVVILPATRIDCIGCAARRGQTIPDIPRDAP